MNETVLQKIDKLIKKKKIDEAQIELAKLRGEGHIGKQLKRNKND